MAFADWEFPTLLYSNWILDPWSSLPTPIYAPPKISISLPALQILHTPGPIKWVRGYKVTIQWNPAWNSKLEYLNAPPTKNSENIVDWLIHERMLGVCGYENDYLRILIGELNIYTVTTIQEYFWTSKGQHKC